MVPRNILLKAKGTQGDVQTVDIDLSCPWMLGVTQCNLTGSNLGATLKTTSGVTIAAFYFLEISVKEDRGAVVLTFSGNSLITGGYLTLMAENPTVPLNGGRPF